MTFKKRVTVASLALLLFVMTIILTPIAFANGVTLTLSDAELSTQFAYETGPGTITAITVANVGEPGVRFDFAGLVDNQGTVVGDNFPVSELAGGAWMTYGTTQQFSTWGDFRAYSAYCLVFENVGVHDVNVNLKINTGWTIPPPEYATAARDTFFQNGWTYIPATESRTVILDFSNAQVYGDEVLSDETWSAVWNLDEVSDIGFQILGYTNPPDPDPTWSIVVSQCIPPTGVPEFTLITPAVAAVGLMLFITTRRYLGKGSFNPITHP